MSSAGVRVGVGTRFRYDGETVEVIEMAIAAPDFITTDEAYFRDETTCFAATRTPELAAALDETARDFLAEQRVRDEPVTWHPPVSLLRDLDLPGPDPSLIDVTRLHELVRERAHPVQHAAEVLGTTVDAVRAVLDEHPAPASPLTETQARAAGRVRDAARQVLTEKEFRRRYIDQHQPLSDIATQTGFSRQVLTRLAAEYGIMLRKGPQHYIRKGVIDRDWLLEQYVGRGRTLPDLAREKNMSTGNMARWAHPDLAAALTRSKRHDYYGVYLVCSFLEAAPETVDQATFSVVLSYAAPAGGDAPVAWSLWPRKLATNPVHQAKSVEGSIGVQPVGVNLELKGGVEEDADVEQCYLVAAGEREPDPEWRFRRMAKTKLSLDGSHHLWLLARVDRGREAVAEYGVTAKVNRPKFGISYTRVDVPDQKRVYLK